MYYASVWHKCLSGSFWPAFLFLSDLCFWYARSLLRTASMIFGDDDSIHHHGHVP